MSYVQIGWNNLWRKGSWVAHDNGSEHPQFPAIDTQVDTPSQPWRSRHGSASGNGVFVIDNDSKYIDVNEGSGDLLATVATGTYNGQTAATAIQTALNAMVGKSLTYTVTYSETTAKFTISASGTFTLKWSTGSHKTTDISVLAGFDDSADDSGAATYTSDYRRIHYPRESSGWVNCGTAQEVTFVAIIGHNIPSDATIKLLGADSPGDPSPVERTLTWTSGSIFQFVTSLTKLYYCVTIAAPDAATAYLQVATILLFKPWTPNRSYGKGFEMAATDFSEQTPSDSLVIFVQEKPKPKTALFPFKGLDDSSRAQALVLIDECGYEHGFLVILDPSSPTLNSYFFLNVEIARPVYVHKNYWEWELSVQEVM